MCDKHERGRPQKIGMIIVSPVTTCAACAKFEECHEPPAFFAKLQLEMAARKAVKIDNEHERAQKAFDFTN